MSDSLGRKLRDSRGDVAIAVQSAPPLLNSAMSRPSLWTWMRNPSNLASRTQPSPVGRLLPKGRLAGGEEGMRH